MQLSYLQLSLNIIEIYKLKNEKEKEHRRYSK